MQQARRVATGNFPEKNELLACPSSGFIKVCHKQLLLGDVLSSPEAFPFAPLSTVVVTVVASARGPSYRSS